MHVDKLQVIREFSNGNKESYYIENNNQFGEHQVARKHMT